MTRNASDRNRFSPEKPDSSPLSWAMARKLFRAFVVFFTVILLGGQAATLAQKGGGGGGDTSGYVIARLEDGGFFVSDGRSGAYDISDRGNVVGQMVDPITGAYVAVYWELNGTASKIVPLWDGAYANGINNEDEIVGYGFEGTKVVAWYWPGPASDPIVLPPLEAGLAAVPCAINDAGVICGYARESVFDQSGAYIGWTEAAVVWRVAYPDGKLVISGPYRMPTEADRSRAYAINECDAEGYAVVVGGWLTASQVPSAAVGWAVRANADGTLEVAPQPGLLEVGEAAAFAVNQSAASCGRSKFKGRVWSSAGNFTLADLPAIKRGYPVYDTHSANDLNDAGVLVGWAGPANDPVSAVMWKGVGSQPVRLSDFLPKRDAPFDCLREATAINNSGVIVGRGVRNQQGHGAFLAIPK